VVQIAIPPRRGHPDRTQGYHRSAGAQVRCRLHSADRDPLSRASRKSAFQARNGHSLRDAGPAAGSVAAWAAGVNFGFCVWNEHPARTVPGAAAFCGCRRRVSRGL